MSRQPQTSRRPARALRVIAVACGVALVSAGCGTDGLASIPLPAPGLGSSGYTLTAVFADALNLPMKAKVKLAGADVGQVESMVARNYTAVTELRIRGDVLLPQGTTAELRTATPLGDVFVSLRPPAENKPSAPMLKDGDTIGLEHTAAASTVESVLSSAALMVNGGTVRNMTNLINGAGKAAGEGGDAFGDLLRKSSHLLGTLDARSGQMKQVLTETSRLADKLSAKDHTISEVLAATGPGTSALAENTAQLSDMAVQAGDTARLLSKFPSIGGTDTSGRSIVRDLNTLAGAANDIAVSPETNWLAINRLMPPVIKATAGDALAISGSVDKLILGAVPDIGFPGDVGLHPPSRYNWNQLIGTLKYTLWRLQERAVGRGPDSPQVPVIPDPVIPGQIDRAPTPPGPQR